MLWGLAGEVYPDQIIWHRLGSGPGPRSLAQDSSLSILIDVS